MRSLRNLLVVVLWFSLSVILAQSDVLELTPAAASKPVSADHKQTLTGVFYQSSDIQQMQADDFANPGLLYVDQGRELFQTVPSQHSVSPGLANQSSQPITGIASSDAPREMKSCQDCHKSMAGVAASFPKRNPRTGQLLSLTGQILECRQYYQQAQPLGEAKAVNEAEALAYESQQALSLTAYIAYQSRTIRFEQVSLDLQSALERGKQYYYQRKGQLNLACHHCHEQNAGRQLRGDLISQGVSTGYPIYRLEWQGLGSLHRRLRACDIGVRAEPKRIGGQVYTEVELYLRHRAGELSLSAPAVRR